MLLTDMASGHQIAAGRSDHFRQMAQFWAFADWSIAQGTNRGEQNGAAADRREAELP
jgi:hypothetical protein